MFKSIEVWDEEVFYIGRPLYFFEADYTDCIVQHGHALVVKTDFDKLELIVAKTNASYFETDGNLVHNGNESVEKRVLQLQNLEDTVEISLFETGIISEEEIIERVIELLDNREEE